MHLLEIGIRIIVGLALVTHAPLKRLPSLFAVFDWVLIASSMVLLVLPCRWHQRFAAQAVPWATRYIGLLRRASIATA